ncbi:MAG: TorF family putative porin [Kiritimatiellia bacterium]|nr:TorF family putative porin [Kiritimatiellia bacterium]
MSRRIPLMGIAALSLLLAQGARAADASVDVGVFSKYVWRGQVLNEDPVVQTALSVDAGNGLSFQVWANLDLTDIHATEDSNPKNEFTEIDLIVSYALPLEGPVGVALSFTEYTFPAGGESTREAAVAITTDLPLSPSLTLTYDFGAVDGFYASLGVEQSFDLTDPLTLTLAASVGAANSDYNEAYFGVSRNRANDGNLSATLDFAVTEFLTLSGAAQYSALLESDIRAAAKEEFGAKDAWVFSLNLNYSF